MGHFRILKLAVLLAPLAACSTPQEDLLEAQKHSYEAQEEVARERLELVEKYQDCVDGANDDQRKIEACESYLKAAEALK